MSDLIDGLRAARDRVAARSWAAIRAGILTWRAFIMRSTRSAGSRVARLDVGGRSRLGQSMAGLGGATSLPLRLS